MSANVVVPMSEREAMLALAHKNGHLKAAELLEISFDTLVRAIAQCGVNRATLTHIRAKLAEVAT